LLNARNSLKEKEKEIDFLKVEIKKNSTTSLPQDSSLKIIETHTLQNSRSREIKSEMSCKAETKSAFAKGKEKRLMSKSAQKYRTQAVTQDKTDTCESCQKLK
jgi:hypothetical protein